MSKEEIKEEDLTKYIEDALKDLKEQFPDEAEEALEAQIYDYIKANCTIT